MHLCEYAKVRRSRNERTHSETHANTTLTDTTVSQTGQTIPTGAGGRLTSTCQRESTIVNLRDKLLWSTLTHLSNSAAGPAGPLHKSSATRTVRVPASSVVRFEIQSR